MFKDDQEAEIIDIDEGKGLSNIAGDILNDTKPKKPKDLATKMKEMLDKAVGDAEKDKDWTLWTLWLRSNILNYFFTDYLLLFLLSIFN